MNTTRALPATPASKPRSGGLAEWINRLIAWLTNSSRNAARIRNWIFTGLFLAVVLPIAITTNLAGWKSHLQAIFVSLFVLADLLGALVGVLKLIWFSVTVLFSPPVLWALLLLLAPFLLAWQLAAMYLQDIFELEHTGVARRYIAQAVFADEYTRIRIRSGSIDPKQEESPLIQIGGPGEVLVELDSAALFEAVNGTPRVVGPTTGRGQHEFIHGFERLREVVDLRDLTTDPITIHGRSRDGIPVIAKDVRLVCSISRPNQAASLEQPYPFREEAVRQLVRQQTMPVTPGQSRIVARDDYWKQTYKRWGGTMPGLIQGALGDFISERDLSQFLANIGRTELEAREKEEAEIRQVYAGAAAEESASGQPTVPETPDFTPRSRLTNLFYDFTAGFPKRAENRGVQLAWIGVGTWETPASAELISRNHLEAWRLSRENYLRGHPNALEHLHEDARLQQLQVIIHTNPLSIYQEAVRKQVSGSELARDLLRAYGEQIKTGLDLIERDQKYSPTGSDCRPDQLKDALRILVGFLAHWTTDNETE